MWLVAELGSFNQPTHAGKATRASKSKGGPRTLAAGVSTASSRLLAELQAHNRVTGAPGGKGKKAVGGGAKPKQTAAPAAATDSERRPKNTSPKLKGTDRQTVRGGTGAGAGGGGGSARSGGAAKVSNKKAVGASVAGKDDVITEGKDKPSSKKSKTKTKTVGASATATATGKDDVTNESDDDMAVAEVAVEKGANDGGVCVCVCVSVCVCVCVCMRECVCVSV